MAELIPHSAFEVPETVNLHIWPRCNLACVYCYGTFPNRPRPLSIRDSRLILDALADAGVRRVTFSGGEPTLHPDLEQMVRHASARGLRTAIVTNGARLTDALLARLDLVGLSIDSADDGTQAALGRRLPGGRSYVAHIADVAGRVHAAGVRLKLNTVVTRLNLHEDLADIVIALRPTKWKPMQVVRVPGENDAMAPGLEISAEEFGEFVDRHERVAEAGIWYEPESAATIRTTYVMVDPSGRVFQHGPAGHLLSEPVVEVGLAHAMNQVGGYDRAEFERRGGHVDVRRLPVVAGAR